MVQFHALGALTVTNNGDELSIGGPRQRRLVAMLLIHRNSVVSVDRLADAVFAGDPTPAASTTLRSYVARMRKVVEEVGSGPSLVTQAPGYRLRLLEPGMSTGGLLRGAARRGAVGARTRGRRDRQRSTIAQALRLWRGDAYAEFADEDWALSESQRLEELRLVAHERLFDVEQPFGDVRLDQFAIDLRDAGPLPVRRWLHAPIATRGLPDGGPDAHMAGGTLRQWFDVIIHRQEVTAAAPIWRQHVHPHSSNPRAPSEAA